MSDSASKYNSLPVTCTATFLEIISLFFPVYFLLFTPMLQEQTSQFYELSSVLNPRVLYSLTFCLSALHQAAHNVDMSYFW